MTLLSGQVIHDAKTLTGTLDLTGTANTQPIQIEVSNGYFAETELSPGKYQARLIPNNPEGVVPEVRIEIPDVDRIEWADLFARPKATRASQPPTNQLRRIPPPDPNQREGSEQPPDYWQREEFLQPATEDDEELVEEEVEAIAPSSPLDRQTKLLLELAARRKK